MDYHSDRFMDCSFLVYKKEKLVAVIPGNIKDDCFYSHQGLTYGGVVSSNKITTSEVVELFSLLNRELSILGVKSVIYKPVPLIYHSVPAQEDIYSLYLNNADKIGCNISSTIFQSNKIQFTESRKSGLRKSFKAGVRVVESLNFSAFWNILETNLLKKFQIKPVHSCTEMQLLESRFPDKIKLYIAECSGEIVAGTILYVMKNIVHVQYISANETGKEIGALDFLFDKLINETYKSTQIFDFGQSTENMGKYLNENLIFQKEGFGGRGIVYDIYQYNITQ